MENDASLLTDAQQFRLDIMKALAEIDVEIDALQQAVEEGKVVSPTRLKELRSNSRQRLEKFLKHHAQHIGPL